MRPLMMRRQLTTLDILSGGRYRRAHGLALGGLQSVLKRYARGGTRRAALFAIHLKGRPRVRPRYAEVSSGLPHRPYQNVGVVSCGTGAIAQH
jgi:hypothetical protein